MNSEEKFKVVPSMNKLKVSKRISLAQLVVLGLLSLTIAIGALPGYLTQKWSWADLPRVPNIQQLKNIRKTGLNLPNWQTIDQAEVSIGGNQWSVQLLEQKGKLPITLYLMPQDYYKNHPQVEWVDLNGIEKWQTDSHKTITFAAKDGANTQVQAHFFRAWKNQTFAVVQWYAWPGGGHFAPSHWFWLDQWAQLSRRRVPWIAVGLTIPINPLSDLKTTEIAAISLAQEVQTQLDQEIFQGH